MRTINTNTFVVHPLLQKKFVLYICILAGSLFCHTPTQAQIDISPITSLLLLDKIVIDGKVVFVTDTISKGNLGGLNGADAICQQEANAAGWSGDFRAWLSDSTTSAAERLTQSTEPYFLPNARRVADNWSDLTDGSLQTAINLNARGRAPAQTCPMTSVWTSTTTSGALSSTNHCSNWTSDSEVAARGTMSFANGRWTENGFATCNFAVICGSTGREEGGRLYCLQQ